VTAKLKSPITEGEASPTDLWDRVRRSLRAKDYRDVHGCIHPDTRRRYLEDLIADVALSSTETIYIDDLKARRARSKLRSILRVFQVTANVEGKEIAVAPIASALLANVTDEGALFDALYTFADAENAHLDPVSALAEDRKSVSSAAPVDLSKTDAAFRNRGGFARLLGLVDGAGELSELRLEGDTATGFITRGKTLYIVRFKKSGERYFIDES
jgi:hypothetical protein